MVASEDTQPWNISEYNNGMSLPISGLNVYIPIANPLCFSRNKSLIIALPRVRYLVPPMLLKKRNIIRELILGTMLVQVIINAFIKV